jgi:hypothetical protein
MQQPTTTEFYTSAGHDPETAEAFAGLDQMCARHAADAERLGPEGRQRLAREFEAEGRRLRAERAVPVRAPVVVRRAASSGRPRARRTRVTRSSSSSSDPDDLADHLTHPPRGRSRNGKGGPSRASSAATGGMPSSTARISCTRPRSRRASPRPSSGSSRSHCGRSIRSGSSRQTSDRISSRDSRRSIWRTGRCCTTSESTGSGSGGAARPHSRVVNLFQNRDPKVMGQIP